MLPRFPLVFPIMLLASASALFGQEHPSGSVAPRHAGVDANAPLPTGAVMRLGETRLRPGARISYLAFSPDGRRLASWGNWLYFEDRLSVWDVATGKEMLTRSMPENMIADLGWGSGGGFAAITSKAGFSAWAFADPTGKLTPSKNSDADKAVRAVPPAPPFQPLWIRNTRRWPSRPMVPTSLSFVRVALWNCSSVKRPNPNASLSRRARRRQRGVV